MGMRIIWGLRDRQDNKILCFFEDEFLLNQYRENFLMRPWFDDLTSSPDAFVPTDDELDYLFEKTYEEAVAERDRLLDIGYERWRIDELNSPDARYVAEKYELWNSVPPNRDRVILHFDSA
jgi:hypothetical protein